MLELDLADSSVRAYRKRDGRISLHLRSYLMVRTTVAFRLRHYMKSIDCQLMFEDGSTIPFDTISYSTCTICRFAFQTMAYHFYASVVTQRTEIRERLARLTVRYHFSFTGHELERPSSFDKIVPIVKRF